MILNWFKSSTVLLAASMPAAGQTIEMGKSSSPVAIVTFSDTGKEIGPFPGCDEPDEDGVYPICSGGLFAGDVKVHRQLSGPKLQRRFTLRFTALEGYRWPKSMRLLVIISPREADQPKTIEFAPFWVRPEKDGRFCATLQQLEDWNAGPMKQTMMRGSLAKIDGEKSRCVNP